MGQISTNGLASPYKKARVCAKCPTEINENSWWIFYKSHTYCKNCYKQITENTVEIVTKKSELTHAEWIKHLENLCFTDTGKRLREYDPIFENWLRETPVDRIIELLESVTK